MDDWRISKFCAEHRGKNSRHGHGSTGGAITGAKLSITNPANGLERDTETGTNGEYISSKCP